MAAYLEIPWRKPKMLLETVICEAGSRLRAAGSDAGAASKSPLPESNQRL